MLEIHAMPGHLIRRLNQIAVAVFTDRVSAAGFDVTPVQFAALAAIADDPGLDQASLAGRIAYDRVTIGGVIDRLENKGYAERRVSPHDRRARALHLTRDGLATLDALRPIVGNAQTDILGGLGHDERRDLITLLKRATDTGNASSRAPLKHGTRDGETKV